MSSYEILTATVDILKVVLPISCLMGLILWYLMKSISKPEAWGYWVAEILLVDQHNEEKVVYRQRVGSEQGARELSQRKAKELHEFFVKAIPMGRTTGSFIPNYPNDAFITSSWGSTSYRLFRELEPINTYNL